MNRPIADIEAIRAMCNKLPRKYQQIAQAWYYVNDTADLICVQPKRQAPRYLNIKGIPFAVIESKIDEFLGYNL